MATYIDHILTPGETVHATARITGWIWFWPIVTSLAILAGLGLALVTPQVRQQPALELGAGVLAVGLLCTVLIGPWIRQSTTNMVVTDRRVIAKFGLISRRAIEMRISKIESIQVDQSLWGRMLNFGTLMVHGTGGEGFAGARGAQTGDSVGDCADAFAWQIPSPARENS